MNKATEYMEKYVDPNALGIYASVDKEVELLHEKPSLKDMQQMVKGSIEFAEINDENYELVANEEGLILELKFNLVAFLITGMYFYGDVIIIKKGVIT
jgi:hypothetical protein